MAEVKVSLEKGDSKKGTPDMLHIRIPVDKNPSLSKSMKTKVLATTNGFQKTDYDYEGHTVSVGLNVTFKDDDCK